jgi:hypothetical protein
MPHKMGKKIKVVFGLEEWKGKCDEKLKGENAMVEFWDDVMERKDRSCKDAIFRVLESKRIITHNRNYCRIAFFWFFLELMLDCKFVLVFLFIVQNFYLSYSIFIKKIN